ncbi:MAG: hypothetical protein IJD10_01565 [Clostridia bacterium]|nr:hypothetical protein [Clostridia bacterium]
MDQTADLQSPRPLSAVPDILKKYALPILSILAAVASFLVCLYYILYPSEGYLHSDCTDSLLWANATVESGKLFDPDFRYAAMLPFSANLWYVPLIAVFGLTMDVQLAGMVIFLVFFSAAIVFLCRSLHFSITASFGTLSAMLLLLSGSDKLREILWGHVIYYSLALLMICLGIALANRVIDHAEGQHRSRTAVFGTLLFLLSLGNALNGFQVIAISTVPVAFAIFGERFFDGEHKLFSKKNLPALALTAGLCVASVGGLILLKMLQGGKVTNYTNIYSMFSDPGKWFDNLAKFPREFLNLFGVTVVNQQVMFSKDSLPDLLLMAAGVLILVLPVVGLFRYKHMKGRGTRQLLLAHVAESAIILLGYICGYFSTGNWRIVPMIGTAILASAAVLREFFADCKEKPVEFRLSTVLCAILVMASAVNANAIRKIPKDYGQDNYLHVLANDLEERGLTYGYATFWFSQAITLISDNEVKCRETLVTNEGIVTDYYQSSKKWYEDQPGVDRYFVILSGTERPIAEASAHWQEIMNDGSFVEHFYSAGFNVYVFNRNIIKLGEFIG